MSNRSPAVQAPIAVLTRHAVLTIICLAGEYPMRTRHLLSDVTDHTIRRTIYRLKESGIVTIVGKGENKSIRLYAKTKGTDDSPKAFEYVESLLGKASLEHYFATTNGHKISGDHEKKARRLRMAEVFALMMRAEIETRPWEMPRIDVKFKNQPKITGSGFYHSRIIKTTPGSTPEKISYARICGLLMSPGGAYGVYNVHHGLIYGATASENKTRGMLLGVLMRCWEPPPDISQQEDAYYATQAIAIGADTNAAVKMYENDGKKKSEFLQLGAAYNDVYFVPLDENGFFVLWMLTQERWRTRILHGLIKPEFLRKNATRDYDAVTDDGMHILAWFDGNLSKLQLFRQTGDTEREGAC